MDNTNDSEETILAIDIGTTNLKCCLFRKNLEIIKSSSFKLNILHLNEGWSEIEPNHLLDTIRDSIAQTLKTKEKVNIKCFGISVQRNSFILFNRYTAKAYTRFILWDDKRNKKRCNSLNNGILFNTVKKSSLIASKLVNNHRMKAFSNYKVDQTHIAPRLLDQLEILESKLEAKEFNDVSYGTIDTWVVWALSKEKHFVSDISCVCCTGFYDLFQGNWSDMLMGFFRIPARILPAIKDTCDDFGNIDYSYVKLNYDIPITSLIGDSQSSLIAECGFNVGDCVITIGTGAFISITVGDKPIASSNGAFPLVTFKKKDEVIYILHCFVSSAGQCIDWAKSIGLFENYEDLDNILKSTKTNNELHFIPAFGLLEIPGWDKNGTACGYIGINATTTKSDLLKSIFNSIAYLIKIKMDLILKDLESNNIKLKSIKICGGVTQSEYFCQLLANLLEFPTEKSNFSYMSSAYGAAFLAGLESGIYKKLDDLNLYRKVEITYQPNKEEIIRNGNYKYPLTSWQRALNRFLNWYKPT